MIVTWSTFPQNCAFLLNTCMLSAEILKKNRRVISETCPFKHKHPRTLNCQHGIGKLPTYSCNVSSLHFNKTGYWNWSCLSLSTLDFTAPLMWQHTETSSTESMFFCEKIRWPFWAQTVGLMWIKCVLRVTFILKTLCRPKVPIYTFVSHKQ